MCGIMGYTGTKPAKNIIYNGLKRMEYRGYDSAGIALLGKKSQTEKVLGDTSQFKLTSLPASATCGLGHTRWATHGKPSVVNAHPHTYGLITLVHNGIIENYQAIKKRIDSKKLKSQTDSEVLAAYINDFYEKTDDLLSATKLALAEVQGTFGLCIFASDKPGQLVAARRGSPLLIGIDDLQYFVASDPAAIAPHTSRVVYLEDDQIAAITPRSLDIYDLKLNQQEAEEKALEDIAVSEGHSGYATFMEKEIHEQPQSLENLMRGRINNDGRIVLGGPNLSIDDMKNLKNILIIGCGTSYYAAFYAKYHIEEMLEIPVNVEHASEFRYRFGAYDPANTLAIFMSQSGETADTLASLGEAKRRGFKTMGIVNVVGSTIAREVTHGGIYLHAGTETAVASTKAYSSMVAALLMFGGFLSYHLGNNPVAVRKLAKQLKNLPEEIKLLLPIQEKINKLAPKLAKSKVWFFLGRNDLYTVALEGALKLTEVAQVHAQAFPTGEMKHGPISLVDKHHLSVVLLPEDPLLYEKGLSAIEELKARGGKVLTISTRPKPNKSDHHLEVAHIGQYSDGLIMNVCLQLLALAMATHRNLNVDKPRNLAKSVTVE